MAYRVELTRRAERDMQDIYDRISAEDSVVSANWFNGLEDAVSSLERMPRRCPLAPESKHWNQPLRHLLYGAKLDTYRVIYTIDEAGKTVRIQTVRHGARDAFLNRK
ncbi:MAG TPA: type II toxin-antitoxin system RelE/ParE family toxin [Candidatus Binataceae bacterium]|nr:type II toxin-antitoxin system RelE/ParE family toxin [Candidatus Binataceae bacterium]